ncbi:MAG: hypothetical protein P8188_06695 [Gemmatimonadota bacterium]
MSGERRSDSGSDAPASTLLVDAHVHLHPGFDLARFFRAAADNFATAARGLGVDEPWRGVLILTESAGTHRFAALRRGAGQAATDGWKIEGTREATSVRLRATGEGPPLSVVAGRQIQTEEGLEVLAFPLLDPVAEGSPVRDVLRAAADAGATTVVPWGFGKWWGARGRIVRELLQEPPDHPFLLADTGHRPSWAGRPDALERWERLGRVTVTGSDPLPFPGEETRAGSCCFALSVPGGDERPAAAVVEALAACARSPRRYESRPGLARFVASQLGMQLRKRAR